MAHCAVWDLTSKITSMAPGTELTSMPHCNECDRLWELYTGLRLKHRQSVLAFKRGDCTQKQLELANGEADFHRNKLRAHKVSHPAINEFRGALLSRSFLKTRHIHAAR